MLLYVFLFLAPWVHADKFTYPPQKLSAAGIEQIKISGVKGRLNLKGNSSKHYKIKVKHSKGKRFEDWSLSIDRQGQALVLEVFNVALGAQWRHLVREELWPEFDIEIEGPSQPAVISWREGDLRIVDWKSAVEAAFLNGRFQSDGMRGPLKLQAVDSQIRIKDHQGPLVLKGEKGRIDLVKIHGTVEVNWLSGVFRGDDLKGDLKIEMPSGNAELKNLKGKLRASGGNSQWEVQAAAPANVEVITESGPVKIRWGKGGAKIFLSSSTGEIKVPKPFAVENRDGLKVVEGIKEKKPQGMVFVRTQSGSISWQ